MSIADLEYELKKKINQKIDEVVKDVGEDPRKLAKDIIFKVLMQQLGILSIYENMEEAKKTICTLKKKIKELEQIVSQAENDIASSVHLNNPDLGYTYGFTNLVDAVTSDQLDEVTASIPGGRRIIELEKLFDELHFNLILASQSKNVQGFLAKLVDNYGLRISL